MKGILQIPTKKISFELDDLFVSQFRRVGTRPYEGSRGMMVEKYAFGETITLVTSNMPSELKEEIELMITRYCNH